MKRWFERAVPLLLLLSLAALLWLGERLTAPAAVPDEPISADAFSARRAMAHVETIAAQPHPAGTSANAVVRDHLLDTLRRLGAEVELQRTLQTYDFARHRGTARFAMVENVIARWPGRNAGPALLLMSHYDSSPAAPGAGDAASGVAAILETVRALAGEWPLRNDLLVVFTDAEELGLLGAQAFFGKHRLAEDVGMVLNFDARGSRGPAVMFETGPGNGRLIDALADHAQAPMGNSLVYSVYRQMPNDTDMSIAKAAGITGMNFAFVHGFFDYHSPTDTPSRLSIDTLQHVGSYALPLARHFGNVPLPPEPSADRHYFNPVGRLFVHYPGWLDWAVWLGAAGLLLVATVRTASDGGVAPWPLLRGVWLALLTIVLPALLVLLVARIVQP